MRILIVSRDPSDPTEAGHLERLEAIWLDCDIHTVAIGEFDVAILGDYDALLIAGAYASQADVPLDALSALTNLVLEPALPVLGIAWGFQVVCLALGDDLEDYSQKTTGAPRLVPTAKGETLFQGSDPIRVNEDARWPLEELPRGWAILASSETGIEAFQSKAKPVLAVQQYPDDFAYESDGKLVYQNLLGMLRNPKK